MKSESYWKKRAVRRMHDYQKQADKAADDIAKAYIKATNYINGEIEKIFRTFKIAGGLTEKEARELLESLPHKNFTGKLKTVAKKIKNPEKQREILNIISSPAYAYRIKRYERLQRDIDLQVSKLAEIEQEVAEAHYVNLTRGAYERMVFDIQKGTGIGFAFDRMSNSRVKEILRNNWSGKLFSERIWGRTGEINRAIQEELLTQFMTGRNYRKTAKAIEARMSVGSLEARRLVRTESTYIANSAEIESYKEMGIKKFKFLATLDVRTSDMCRGMDGKEFDIEDAAFGVNVPPLHPWCRSTTIAVIDSAVIDKLKRSAKDPKTGQYYTVSADANYEEWKKSVDKKYGEGTWDVERKKIINRATDKRQYERYKTVLGKSNMPKSFDLFQEIKYNKIEEWEDLKYYCRNINGRPIEYVKIDRDLEKRGIRDKGKAYPVEDVTIKGWREHAKNRLELRGITESQALSYKAKAIVMLKRYPEPNAQWNYYSSKGVIGIRISDHVVCTAFDEKQFKNDTLTVLEVCEKWLNR